MDFYAPVDEATIKCVKSAGNVVFFINKKDSAPYWPRLLKQAGKSPHWLKTDFARWQDEDFEEEAAPENPMGGMGGPGGMDMASMMGGMGGMGGAPGGMDMASMMGGMGGAPGGMDFSKFGDMDFSKMAESMGNDPNAVMPDSDDEDEEPVTAVE